MTRVLDPPPDVVGRTGPMGQRALGRHLLTMHYDQQSDGSAVAWCPSFSYRNEAGSWVAPAGRTSISAAGLHDITSVLKGAGRYAGLEYHQHVEGTTFPWSVTGWIDAAE